jgi:hypothetical protein
MNSDAPKSVSLKRKRSHPANTSFDELTLASNHRPALIQELRALMGYPKIEEIVACQLPTGNPSTPSSNLFRRLSAKRQVLELNSRRSLFPPVYNINVGNQQNCKNQKSNNNCDSDQESICSEKTSQEEDEKFGAKINALQDVYNERVNSGKHKIFKVRTSEVFKMVQIAYFNYDQETFSNAAIKKDLKQKFRIPMSTLEDWIKLFQTGKERKEPGRKPLFNFMDWETLRWICKILAEKEKGAFKKDVAYYVSLKNLKAFSPQILFTN